MLFKKTFIFIGLTIATNIHPMEEMERSAVVHLSGSTRPARIVREPVSEDIVIEDVKAFLATLKMSNLQYQTSYVERWRYGFNGNIMPMWKRNGGKVELVDKSCIIEGAQPSRFYGLWYSDTHVPSTRLFLELEGNRKLEAIINQATSHSPHFEADAKIHACCLVDDKPTSINRLAIAWEDLRNNSQKKSYITMVPVMRILISHMIQSPQPAQIDLDENKVEVISERVSEEA